MWIIILLWLILISSFNIISYKGSFISGFIFPQLSDKKGGRSTLIFAILLGGVAAVLTGFSTNFFIFTVLITIAGIGMNGFETNSLVYVSEISG